MSSFLFMLGTAIKICFGQIHDRVSNVTAQAAILRLRRAIQEAEREVPGLINVFISEIVDSVEPELDD